MATALRVTSALRVAARSGTQVRSMATGTVKWFNEKKGFGFITPDESGDSDLFVHHSVVQSKGFRFLVEGEKVTYDKGQGDKGPQAMNVTDETGKPFVRPQRRFGDGEGAPRRERRPREDREYQ